MEHNLTLWIKSDEAKATSSISKSNVILIASNYHFNLKDMAMLDLELQKAINRMLKRMLL